MRLTKEAMEEFQALCEQECGETISFEEALYPVPSFDILTVSGDGGYAEYWPIELRQGADRDRLILYNNAAAMDADTLMSTLLHEAYPGHGLFYDLIRRKYTPFIDHGSMALVEGWATWFEWNVIRNDYARFNRAARLRSLLTFRLADSDEVIERTDLLRAERQARDPREEQLNLFFQYPGFAFCYTLGALWFDQRFRIEEAEMFLSLVRNRPWGDFFQHWSQLGAI